jgi:hypothetical protein
VVCETSDRSFDTKELAMLCATVTQILSKGMQFQPRLQRIPTDKVQKNMSPQAKMPKHKRHKKQSLTENKSSSSRFRSAKIETVLLDTEYKITMSYMFKEIKERLKM